MTRRKKKRMRRKPRNRWKPRKKENKQQLVPIFQSFPDPIVPESRNWFTLYANLHPVVPSGAFTPSNVTAHPHDAQSAFQPKVSFDGTCVYTGTQGPTGMTPVWSSSYKGLLVSEGHKKLKNGAWSGGGPLYVVKREITHGGTLHYQCRIRGTPTTYVLHGCNLGTEKNRITAPPLEASQWSTETSALQGAYASGYAKARPGNPVASVGQFLWELRDFPQLPFRSLFKGARLTCSPTQLPRLLLHALKNFRALGSEYLNVVFGWKPFIGDLQKMYMLQQTLDKRMNQIIRENGRNIRRKATVQNDQSMSSGPYDGQTSTIPFYGVNGMPPYYWEGRTEVIDKTWKSTRVWFSGGFRYWIPNVNSPAWSRKAKMVLFGALPTPEVIWSVIPWSWLIDWFTNFGDVISNLSTNAVDNLVCNYSFIMRHVVTKRVLEISTTCLGGQPPLYNNFVAPAVSMTFSYTDCVETKSRLGGGNPFGLGVKLTDLSASQLAILAALGISRSEVR